ncbi:cation channel sperm-associated protein 2-like isoform X2 [Acanthaster planci]|uniref:Cation channel sperm-associated protein 2-like isoform X2 n=1 Tax=Acanthaster planci TaxID=133434 RepID=A0A8B7ZJ34_ACAPL|nr:cation channel sperm-associated protein 2-like isoform X2 [Acanthaster planci]
MDESGISNKLFDDLTPQAEIFRSKLIEDFHLLDSLDVQGQSDAPKYYSKDLADTLHLQKMMLDNPAGLVKFQVYSSKAEVSKVSKADRRKNRVRNKNSKNPPLNMWAHFVLESSVFQNFMLLLILANSIALGIQSEVSGNGSPSLAGLKQALDIFDYCSLFLFMVEIILKWIDDFISFWKNGWNIFDFFVTVGSFVPEIIVLTVGDLKELRVIVSNLRVFRILRSLKMVSRFQQARLIALAITKAFKAMTFIMLLLLLFAYIFAIAGVIFFDSYTRSDREDLQYKDSFSTITRALITLFQLFTLDQWYKVLMDMWKVADRFFTTFYLMLWICIGSFIFRNIFVGIMVNNFQSIRNDLFDEVKGHEETRQIARNAEKFNEELTKQDQKLKARRMTIIANQQLLAEAAQAGRQEQPHGSTRTDDISTFGAETDRRSSEDSIGRWATPTLLDIFKKGQPAVRSLPNNHPPVLSH